MDLLTLAVALKNGGGGGGGSEVTVDPSLSPSSPNPVRNSAIYAALDGKADKTALDGYATDEDVEDAIQDAIGDITRFEYYLCGAGEYDAQGIPTVTGADTNHIYLTPTAGTNLNMYAYISNTFVFLGTTEVDLDDYAKTADVNAALANKADASHNHDDRYYTETEVDTALSGKADSNHNHDSRYYTESEMDTKLNGKSNTGHTHAYSEITGTPTIPTVPSNLTLGKNGGTNTQLIINIIDSGTPASGTPDTTITIVKG